MEDFEKRMKEYFRERELKVSEDAWNRMESLLDKAPGNKDKKYMPYIATIAASVLVTLGLWTLFNKARLAEPGKLENKPAFVINDTVLENLKEHTGRKTYVNTSGSRPERKPVKKEIVQGIRKNAEQTQKEPLFPVLGDVKEEEAVVTGKPLEHLVEPHATASVHKAEQTGIYVNREKLLRNAEIERQLDNTVTNGENFWRKIKGINTVVENSK